ncbi:MAG: hypothetical protein KF861_06995 [Planctomycetaceae bacterium]|nr:hypothetical protein [Planctomycetaceae bacterium]
MARRVATGLLFCLASLNSAISAETTLDWLPARDASQEATSPTTSLWQAAGHSMAERQAPPTTRVFFPDDDPHGASDVPPSGQQIPEPPAHRQDDAAAAQAAQAKAAAEAAAGAAQLAASVEEIGKRLTVLTVTPDVKVILGGAVVADFLVNEARPLAPGTPFFLLPGSPFGFDQTTFDAHARASNFFALFTGPKICNEWETGGLVLLTLYNDALIVDRYGILPVQAFGQVKNDDWRFAAGLQLDIFNPLNPTVLPFSLLLGSGNTGAFRGQARVERFFHLDDCSQITLTGGIGDAVPTIVSNDFDVSEDNGWPNLEGRVAFSYGALEGAGPTAKRPLEIGVSGIVGEIRNITPVPPVREIASVWGLGGDARCAFTDRFGMQGEVYVGETLGTYCGSVMQTVNTTTLRGISSVGGWAEVYYYIVPECLHTHVGYGVDNPDDADLAPGQIARNETVFANLLWDITKFFRVGFELTYRETAYQLLPDNHGIGAHTQFQWKF